MNSDLLLFRPVIEAPWYENEPLWPWQVADIPAFTHIPLNGAMTDFEVGSMVAALCNPLELEPHSEASTVFRELNNLKDFSLSGGLEIVKGSTLIIEPGCCSAIEHWRELYTVLDSRSPWMGHDPDPWCEFLDDGAVRFWAAGGMTGDYIKPMVTFSRQQVVDELERFHNALRDAMHRFQQWLIAADCQFIESLTNKFRHSFAITVDKPL